jgi:tetratricopeptide (TPR) repeat protein
MNKYVLIAVLSSGFINFSFGQDLVTRLDALEKAMAESREIATRTESSLEDARRELYNAALRAREVKQTGDAMIESGAAGISADTIDHIRNYMVLSARELRALRDLVEALDEIAKANGDNLAKLEDDFVAVKNEQKNVQRSGPPPIARPGEVQELTSQLTDAQARIAVQNNTIKQLNDEVATLRSAIAAPKVTVVSREEETAPQVDYLKIGSDALIAGMFEDAADAFNEALRMDPGSVNARLGLASCYFEFADLEAANKMVDEVLDIESRNSRALGLRGAIRYRMGNASAARRDLERAIRYDENNAINYNYLGVVLQQLSKQNDAIRQLKRSVELDPEYASARYNLSVLLATADQPDLEAARAEYGRYLQLGGTPSEALESIIGTN